MAALVAAIDISGAEFNLVQSLKMSDFVVWGLLARRA
jgi:hypothetical protein